MSSVNDLCKRLGIRHPLEQSTCIGYGQRKPTCGCAVAEASRLSAFAQLQDLNDDLNFGAGVSNEILHNIASLLLCKRWHQSQAGENVQSWRRALRASSATPSRSAAPTASSTVTPAQSLPVPQAAPVPRQSLQSFSDGQLMNEIKRRLQDAHNDELLREVAEVVTAAIERHNTARIQRRGNPSSNNPRSNIDETSRPNAARSPEAAPLPQTTTAEQSNRANPGEQSQNRHVADMTTSYTQAPTQRTTPAIENVRQARLAALTPIAPPPRPEPPARAPSPIRWSHVECVVCTMTYEEDPDEHWECRSCLNRVHMHCFRSWQASQLPGRVTCIHCRTRILEEIST